MIRLRVVSLALALSFMGTSAAFAAGDATKGQKVFKKCAACHSLEAGKKKIGPSLHGVIGRTAGTAKGYKYSKAMKAYGKTGVVWGEETLEIYLTAPRNVVKGTKMAFPGLKKPQDRADIIAYLRSTGS